MARTELNSLKRSLAPAGEPVDLDSCVGDVVKALKDRVRECEVASVGPIEDLPTDDDEFSFMRTAGLLRLDPVVHQVPIEPELLQLVEALLGKNPLLSAISAMDVQPGKVNIQPIHPDDALVPVPRPHFKPIGCTAMWVLTDFNAHTGGPERGDFPTTCLRVYTSGSYRTFGKQGLNRLSAEGLTRLDLT